MNTSQVLYYEGKRPGLFNIGLPIIYITFLNNDSIQGLTACDSQEMLGDGWNFNFTKINDSTFEAMILKGIGSYIILPKDFEKLILYKSREGWYCKLENYDSKIVLKPYIANKNNEYRRNWIYYYAKVDYGRYYFNRLYSWNFFSSKEYGMFHIEKDTFPFLHLPYIEATSEIDKRWIKELTRIKNIDSFVSFDDSNHKFVLSKNIDSKYVESGVIKNPQMFFNLIKQASPIDEPKGFSPNYKVEIKYHKFFNGKDFGYVALRNMDFLFNDTVFKYESYWYSFDKDITKELNELVNK
jgi:hypothetical protein